MKEGSKKQYVFGTKTFFMEILNEAMHALLCMFVGESNAGEECLPSDDVPISCGASNSSEILSLQGGYLWRNHIHIYFWVPILGINQLCMKGYIGNHVSKCREFLQRKGSPV